MNTCSCIGRNGQRIQFVPLSGGGGGLTLAFYTDWPTSFWITALSGLVYLASLAARLRAR